MSSADESTTPAHKKRKLQRACDYCRRKKIRCDGSQMPDNRCSKCTARKTECTYKDALHKGSYPSSYVEHLESRLERMETLLSKLCPDEGPSRELETAQPEKEHLIHTPISEKSGSRHNSATPPTPTAMALTPQTPAGSDEVQRSDEEDDVQLEVSRQFQKLSIAPRPYRYHGRSSALVFLRSAIDLKNQFSENPQEAQNKSSRPPPWLEHAFEHESPTLTSFPPDDLLDTLVSLYFRYMNDTLPLLHEPTFRNGVNNGLHLRHGGFGATVLLVCANGSRYTDDRRVLVDGSENWESAGWKWYLAVKDTRKLPLAPAQLYDLQIYALMATFLQGSTAPQVGWNLVGVGIRVAIDVGVHRRKLYSTPPTIEEELWKRAFWALVMLDWSHCYGLGRPSSIHDEDIDVALPIEVDDEYWITSDGEGHEIKQPEGKPSKISFFVHLIRLCQILAFASRTIYSINKSRSRLGQGDSQWEQRIVAEIDSILNKWMDSLPQHLRWDPDQPDRLFLMQAGILRVQFYHLQIAAHRPFMSVSRRESPLTFPSVIICTNAARSCVQVLDTLYKREGSAHYRNMGMLFLAGVVLMMNIWAQRRSGRSFHSGPDLAYVRSCMKMLEGMQREVNCAPVLRDILDELLSANPLPASGNSSTGKASGSDSTSTLHTAGPPATSQSYASATFAQPRSQGLRRTSSSSHFRQEQSSLPTPECDRIPPPNFQASSAGTFFPQHHSEIDAHMSAFSSSSYLSSSSQDLPAAAARQGQGREAHNQATHTGDFNLGNLHMFGLEPLSYSEAVSLFPSVAESTSNPKQSVIPQLNEPSSSSSSAVAQMYNAEMPMPMSMAFEEGLGGAATPDFAFIDDTLSMWQNAPTSFSWDDWSAYISGSSDASLGQGQGTT